MGFFDKIKAGLTKTRDALSSTLGSVFSGFSEIDDDFYDELEECLILADLGVTTACKAAELLRKTVKEQRIKTAEEAMVAIRNIRRDAIDKFKKQQKASEITEDDSKVAEKDIQKLTL